MSTAVEAVRIGWPAYLIPFLFAASPALLFDGETWLVGVTFAKALIGVFVITGGIVGFMGRKLPLQLRVVSAACGLAILYPWESFNGAVWLNVAGVTLAFVLMFFTLRRA